MVQSGKESLRICVTDRFHLDKGDCQLLSLRSTNHLEGKWQWERLGDQVSTRIESHLFMYTVCLDSDKRRIHNRYHVDQLELLYKIGRFYAKETETLGLQNL